MMRLAEKRFEIVILFGLNVFEEHVEGHGFIVGWSDSFRDRHFTDRGYPLSCSALRSVSLPLTSKSLPVRPIEFLYIKRLSVARVNFPFNTKIVVGSS